MKRLLHTPLALLVWRIALLYAALMLCRAAFWVYNAALLGPPEWSELGQLVAGSLKFDTASVVYADGVFILLSLLPLHLRERRWYRGMLFWYYVVVNAVLVAAANLADTVYFRYTQKRFTADEIFFADNDNSLQLVGKVHGRELVFRAAVGGTRGAAGVGLPAPGARGERFQPRLGLLCRRHEPSSPSRRG